MIECMKDDIPVSLIMAGFPLIYENLEKLCRVNGTSKLNSQTFLLDLRYLTEIDGNLFCYIFISSALNSIST